MSPVVAKLYKTCGLLLGVMSARGGCGIEVVGGGQSSGSRVGDESENRESHEKFCKPTYVKIGLPGVRPLSKLPGLGLQTRSRPTIRQ
jgi:hypothetical protein